MRMTCSYAPPPTYCELMIQADDANGPVLIGHVTACQQSHQTLSNSSTCNNHSHPSRTLASCTRTPVGDPQAPCTCVHPPLFPTAIQTVDSNLDLSPFHLQRSTIIQVYVHYEIFVKFIVLVCLLWLLAWSVGVHGNPPVGSRSHPQITQQNCLMCTVITMVIIITMTRFFFFLCVCVCGRRGEMHHAP